MTAEVKGPQSTVPHDDRPTPMDLEIKAAWLEDLRSGNFHQGTQYLHTYDRNEDGTEKHEFCCLGVLCERAVEAGVVERVLVDDVRGIYGYRVPGDTSGKRHVHYPPPEVTAWARLPYGDTNPYVTVRSDPGVMISRDTIANVNDEGTPFDEIADIIESNF